MCERTFFFFLFIFFNFFFCFYFEINKKQSATRILRARETKESHTTIPTPFFVSPFSFPSSREKEKDGVRKEKKRKGEKREINKPEFLPDFVHAAV